MFNPQLEVLIIAILVSTACSILGVFLILRKMSMMSDAISHTILLGIVIAFFITHDITSPFLIIGAAIMGTITVHFIEMIHKTKLVSSDSAIGLIFPLFFSIAVILISFYAGDIHLDTDSVLLGEIAFAPFNRVVINNIDFGPKAIYIMGTILILNLLYIIIFYKELKLTTFDSNLAKAFGFYPVFLQYSLMSLVSLTVVGAFDSVGAILVVAFMVGPPACAYLLTKNLKKMIVLSIIIGAIDCIIGYYIAIYYDVAIAGSIASFIGFNFIIVFLFNPKRGYVYILKDRKNKKYDYAVISFLMHLINHKDSDIEKEESSINTISKHLQWDEEFLNEIISIGKIKNFIIITKKGIIRPTTKGENYAIKNYYDFISEN
ncbi:MAG: metal ABC transporter permease [Peptostreptococcaceae bacterium]|jgi:manganese/zinc/iron transport system permease protein|nr:metal ABC transporter permease [Peptostreptococcaceae bacterium]